MKNAFKKVLCLALIVGIVATMSFALVACNDTDTKVITVGYTIFNPMNYLDSDGNLVGFDTELAQKTFADLGYKVVFKEIEWNNKYMDLDAGNIDCLWNGFTSNSSDDGKSRGEIVDLSYNYMINYQAVVINSADASTITSIASLAGKTGYSEEGSAGEEYADTFTGANVQTTTSQMAALQQLLADACDFATVDYLLANSLVGQGGFASLQIVTALNSSSEYYAIAFKKGSDLTAKVNAQLEAYAADGSLATLAAKYNLSNALISDYTSQKNA